MYQQKVLHRVEAHRRAAQGEPGALTDAGVVDTRVAVGSAGRRGHRSRGASFDDVAEAAQQEGPAALARHAPAEAVGPGVTLEVAVLKVTRVRSGPASVNVTSTSLWRRRVSVTAPVALDVPGETRGVWVGRSRAPCPSG